MPWHPLLNTKGHISYRNTTVLRAIDRGTSPVVRRRANLVMALSIYSGIAIVLSGLLFFFGHSFAGTFLLLYGVYDIGKFFSNPR
jgi:hypothetical protein